MATDETIQPPGSKTGELVESLVRGIAAYRQDSQLYPPDHPRLKMRSESLYFEFIGFMSLHRGVFTLQVREGGLYSNNEELASSGAIARMATLLRERMIQLVEIRPGVTPDEISGFVNLLLDDPHDAIQSNTKCRELGPHLRLFSFDATFAHTDNVLSEEEVVEVAQMPDDGGTITSMEELVASSEVGDTIAALKEIGWDEFSKEQMKCIEVTLSDVTVRKRIDEVRSQVGSAHGDDFLPAFFEILRRDPRTDWSDRDALTQALTAGLLLLNQAATEVGKTGAVPAQLLTPEDSASDQLTTSLRWRLIRNFFPGTQETSPRPCEDLSSLSETKAPEANSDGNKSDFDWESARGEWHLTEIPEEDWGRTDPESLKAAFEEQFAPTQTLPRYAAVLSELVTLQPEYRDALRDGLVAALDKELPKERVPAAQVRMYTESIAHLPPEQHWLWHADILARCARPADVFELVTDGHPEILEPMMTHPQALLDEGPSTTDQPLDLALATLRNVIARDSRFMLDLLLAIYRDRMTAGLVKAWTPVVRKLSAEHGDLPGWIQDNINEMSDPHGVLLILSLDVERVKPVLLQHFKGRGLHHLQRFLSSFPTVPMPASTELLMMGLEVDSTSVRKTAITALSRQGSPSSLNALEDLLRDYNFRGKFDVEEVEQLTAAIARHSQPGARGILENIVNQKKGWRHAFRKTIRNAAKQALQRGGQQ